MALECGVQSKLLLTDQQEMLELMQHNIQLNELESRAKALILNWCVVHRQPPSDATAQQMERKGGKLLTRDEKQGRGATASRDRAKAQRDSRRRVRVL